QRSAVGADSDQSVPASPLARRPTPGFGLRGNRGAGERQAAGGGRCRSRRGAQRGAGRNPVGQDDLNADAVRSWTQPRRAYPERAVRLLTGATSLPTKALATIP